MQPFVNKILSTYLVHWEIRESMKEWDAFVIG